MNRLWVLGAGASIDHTDGVFPSITQFFKAAKENEIITKTSTGRKVRPEYEPVYQYVKRVFGKSVLNTSHYIDIERLLTHLEIESQAHKSLQVAAIQEAIQDLVADVLLALQKKSQRFEEGAYSAFERELQSTDAVISFNWDTLLDERWGPRVNALTIGTQEPGVAQYAALSSNFINVAPTEFPQQFIDGRHYQPPPKLLAPPQNWESVYLKLHGSIDWFQCASKNCIASGDVHQFPPEASRICAKCREPLSRLIVQPVANKQVWAYAGLWQQWKEAARLMRLVDRLVIWGYGLPPTDFHAAWLLRQAERQRLREISIVNPAIESRPGTGRVSSIFKRHILEPLWRCKAHAAIRFYLNLEDFLKGREFRAAR